MKPFLTDRPRVGAPPQPAATVPAAGAFALAGKSAAGKPVRCGHEIESPRIECVREGDRITRLVITCACGERIEIDCLYAAGK